MSPREALQERLYQFITSRNFDAPYGVLCGQESFGKKARTITFGRARTLDATVRIFGPTFIALRHSRGYGTEAFTGPNAEAECRAAIAAL